MVNDEEKDLPRLVFVAALDEGRVIGREGDLPWRLPADLRHFKEVTLGHPLLMGRGTYESLGQPLPGRKNIVLTSQKEYEAPGCVVVSSIDEALSEAASAGADTLMVLGGESVFRQLLPRADAMILTVVHGRYEGDTYFPGFESDDWEVVSSRFRRADEKNEVDMTFVELRAKVDDPRRVDERSGPGPLPEILKFSNLHCS